MHSGETGGDIAAAAARWVVEEGLDYGAAKRRAVRALGLPARTPLPDNDTLEAAVREYIDVFCGEAQPGQLQALRELALSWMDRLSAFNPLIEGAVWNGTATRLSDIHLCLFTDDPKGLEIWLLDQRLHAVASPAMGRNGLPLERLSISVRCTALGEDVGLHLTVHPADGIRGALVAGGKGRAQRGGANALRQRMAAVAGTMGT